jgi:hypothetical protein
MRIDSEAPKRVAMVPAQHARRTSSTLLILFGPCLSVAFPRSDRIEELTACFVVKDSDGQRFLRWCDGLSMA